MEKWENIYSLAQKYLGNLLPLRTSILHALKESRCDQNIDFYNPLRIAATLRYIKQAKEVIIRVKKIKAETASAVKLTFGYILEKKESSVEIHNIKRSGRSWKTSGCTQNLFAGKEKTVKTNQEYC